MTLERQLRSTPIPAAITNTDAFHNKIRNYTAESVLTIWSLITDSIAF